MNNDGFAIYVGDDDVYYTKAYTYATEATKLDGSGVLMLVCVPQNGRNRGKIHKFPMYRVTHIVNLDADAGELA